MKMKMFALLALTTSMHGHTNLYQEVGDIRLNAYIKPIEKEEEEITDPKKQKLQLSEKEISDYEMYRDLFNLFQNATHKETSDIINANLIKDLALLLGDHAAAASIIQILTQHVTSIYGNGFAAGLITSPTQSISVLHSRQALISEFINNTQLATTTKSSLEILHATEKNYFGFFQKESDFTQQTINKYYFTSKKPVLRNLHGFNTNAAMLQIARIAGMAKQALDVLMIPVGYYVTTHYLHKTCKKAFADFENNKEQIIANLRNQNRYTEEELEQKIQNIQDTLKNVEDGSKKMTGLHGIKEFFVPSDLVNAIKTRTFERKDIYKAALPAYINYQQIKAILNAYRAEKQTNDLTNYLHAELNGIADMVQALQALDKLVQSNPKLKTNLVHAQDLHALFTTKNNHVSEKMHKLIALLLTNTFKSAPSYFSLKGRVLAAHALMNEIKTEFAAALHAAGEIDAYLAFATLYTEHTGTQTPYSFAQYIVANKPCVVIEGMWNPLVNTQTTTTKIVTNSIKLGADQRQNIILTGPNAGGKSTFLKGTSISIILGQTIGMAPVSNLAFTPFAKINTYMNITDDTAAGKSLFKAEVERAQKLLSSVINLGSKGFSFSIMDEMFSGTSPKEGEAASYAVAKKLGSLGNSIMLLASHFQMLKALEVESPHFKNYQVRVIRHANGTFSYPFKLEEGAADQNVAIDLLKQQGFNTSILDEAQDILAAQTA